MPQDLDEIEAMAATLTAKPAVLSAPTAGGVPDVPEEARTSTGMLRSVVQMKTMLKSVKARKAAADLDARKKELETVQEQVRVTSEVMQRKSSKYTSQMPAAMADAEQQVVATGEDQRVRALPDEERRAIEERVRKEMEEELLLMRLELEEAKAEAQEAQAKAAAIQAQHREREEELSELLRALETEKGDIEVAHRAEVDKVQAMIANEEAARQAHEQEMQQLRVELASAKAVASNTASETGAQLVEAQAKVGELNQMLLDKANEYDAQVRQREQELAEELAALREEIAEECRRQKEHELALAAEAAAQAAALQSEKDAAEAQRTQEKREELKAVQRVLGLTAKKGDRVKAQWGDFGIETFFPATVIQTDAVNGTITVNWDDGGIDYREMPANRAKKEDRSCLYAGISRRILVGKWERAGGKIHEVYIDESGRVVFSPISPLQQPMFIERRSDGIFLGEWVLDEERTTAERLEFTCRGSHREWTRI